MAKSNGKTESFIPDEIHLEDNDEAFVEMITKDIQNNLQAKNEMEARIAQNNRQIQMLQEQNQQLAGSVLQASGAINSLTALADKHFKTFADRYPVPAEESGYKWNVDGDRKIIVVKKKEEVAAD
jgi:hypothetical protein